MTVLVLTKKPFADTPYHRWLPGEELVLLAELNAETSAAGWVADRERDGYAHVELFDRWKTNGAVEVRALELHDTYAFEAVVALSECDVLRAARLRGRLGLRDRMGVGEPTFEQALPWRDKLVSRQRLAAAGLPGPPFAPVDAPGDAVAFLAAHPGPAVVKPRAGSGSVGVAVVRDADQVYRWAARRAGLDEPLDALVEGFVDGPLYSVDGVVDGARLVSGWVSRYDDGCLPALERGRALSLVGVPPDAAASRDLLTATEQVLAGLGAGGRGSLHAEFFRPPGGPPVLCELHGRTGGGAINAVARAARGVDLEECAVRGQAGRPFPPLDAVADPPLLGFTLLFPRAGRLLGRPDRCPVRHVRRFVPRGAVGLDYSRPGKVSATIGWALYDGRDTGDLLATGEAVAAWFDDACRWETG